MLSQVGKLRLSREVILVVLGHLALMKIGASSQHTGSAR